MSLNRSGPTYVKRYVRERSERANRHSSAALTGPTKEGL